MRFWSGFLALLLGGLSAAPADAQTPSMRIRGTIEAVDATTLTVKSRDGQTLAIKLNDPLTVSAMKKVPLGDIQPNSYVGIASRTGTGGSVNAIEVLVFPEAMRGAGEGHYPWDLEPGSMMTNGTVTGTVDAASGKELTLKFKDSATVIHVTPDAPVVTFVPAAREDLKPGAAVFLSATKSAEGQLSTGRVTVGKDGVNPPM